MSVEIDLRVIPRSSRSKVESQPDGTLKVWLHAAPVDGQANAALVEVLSDVLRLPKSSVQIVRGEKGRSKRVRIEGIELSDLHERLSL